MPRKTLAEATSTLTEFARFFAHLPRGISMKEARKLDPEACRRAGVFMDAHRAELTAELTGLFVAKGGK